MTVGIIAQLPRDGFSSFERAEEMSEVLKIDDFRELDRNFAVDGEENAEGHGCRNLATDNEIQVEFNKQGQQDSSSFRVGLREGNMRCSYGKSHSVPTEFDQDNAGRTNIDYDQERTQSPSNGKHYQGEMDELSGSYFQKSSFEFKAQTLHDERGTEGSAHPQESPLTADSNQVEEPECNPDVNKPNTSHQDEEIKYALLEKSTYEFTNSPDKEIEGQTIEHETEKLSSYSRSPSGDGEGEPRNEKYNSSKNSPSESGQLDLSHSISHSPGSTHRRSASPVTVNQMLVSPEGSPHLHLSPNGHRPSLPLQEGVQDELHSRTQHKQKHAASPERSDLAKRISSNRRLSPSATQSSASPKRSRHKNGSSLKHMSASPEPRYSPKKYRRHDRSMSRSPIQRRDPSSGYGRNYRDKSRSRSPYMRNHYRSPRRRCSPRRRSPPGYHSRHHSPRQRPWSPPPNRKTGVGKPGKNLFVAGFSFLTTERDLERKFSRFGRVQDVRIVRDKRSGDSRGFGFLSLETDEDADAAIRALDETEWNGRVILVEKSKSTR
ncbi:serine/arginine repetitive matrix protein 1-like isoform X2 [Pistacia vera]|uniref:serine/arginine repetitive matrix protein 1-like isoform X2 n=1 Tax=Pistacia vera TaxID=55513 RepID=UPI0012637D4E|nr:serine/arginine repetitive matrix protein 1-like isoform X2 [Pistacia vera]